MIQFLKKTRKYLTVKYKYSFKLKKSGLIPDKFEDIGYITNPILEIIKQQNWGCGCFYFTKV